MAVVTEKNVCAKRVQHRDPTAKASPINDQHAHHSGGSPFIDIELLALFGAPLVSASRLCFSEQTVEIERA
jgi:hypothetical protein